MNFQDVALICENGHVINSSSTEYPEDNSSFCRECGAKTIDKCPSCLASIKGNYHYDGVIGFDEFDAPSYCGDCGCSYPWTAEKLKAIQEVMSMANLTEEDEDDFNKNLVDIVSDTPRTNVAALKIKMIGSKVTSEIWEVAKGIIVEIASETAKKTMGL